MFPRSIKDLTQVVNGKPLSQWADIFIHYMYSIDHEFDPGHRIDHVARVAKTAIEFAHREGADMAIIVPAVILHDTFPVGKFTKERSKASALSADRSIQLLSDWGYPREYDAAIRHVIIAHSFSAGVTPESLEAKIVQDADRLDAIGAIGIARTMAVGFRHGNPLYHAEEPFPVTREPNDNTNILDHFYVKLFSLTRSLHTLAAQEEGARRIHVMETYLQSLANEIGASYISYQDFLNKREMQQKLSADH